MIAGETADMVKEGLARGQGGADQLIGVVAEGQEAVKEEGQDV